MRLGALSSAAAVATLFASPAGAMPIPAYHPELSVTLVAGGCGYGWHRNIYGNCVVNGPGWGGVVVAPGYYGYGAPGYYHGGYYHGGGWHGGYYHGGGYHGGGWHGGGARHGAAALMAAADTGTAAADTGTAAADITGAAGTVVEGLWRALSRGFRTQVCLRALGRWPP